MIFQSTTTRALLFVAFLPQILATNHIDIALQKRQNIGPLSTGPTTSAAPPTSNPPASSTAAPTTNAPQSAVPSTTSAPAVVSSGSTDVPTAQSTASVTSSQVLSQSTSRSQTTSAPSPDSSGSRSESDSEASLLSTSTRSDGSTVTLSKSVSSSSKLVTSISVVTSGSSTISQTLTTSALVAVSTSSPQVVQGDKSSNSSGVTPEQKRIIIGVVVGIGGAIILGGLAVVAWRIWGRKRNVGDDDNDLMDSHPGSSGKEKRSSVSGSTPFRSTLDQYHNTTPGPVNTASNF